MRVALLGPLVLTSDEDSAVRVSVAAKPRAVLAWLALRAPSPVGAPELLEVVWGDELPVSASKTLQKYVSDLRKLSPGDLLETVGRGYRLGLMADDVDVNVFEGRLREARRATSNGDIERARDLLTEALGLWRGDPLPDLVSRPKGFSEVARLEELRRTAVEDLLEARLSLGEDASLVGDLEAAVAVEPLRERRWAQLMLALYRSGRQADAVRAFQNLRRLLGEELGLEPGPEAKALEMAIATQDPSLSLEIAGPPGENERIPSGIVTLLFTDIAGSTQLWERHPEKMDKALKRHDELLRSAIEGSGGHVFKTVGDGFCASFFTASDGVRAAVSSQRLLFAEPWPEETRFRVRMALHTGECEERDGDYFGQTVNRTARLESIAHGGQVIISRATADVIRDQLPEGVALHNLGTHRLKDLGLAEDVFQVEVEGLDADFPPLRSLDNPALLNNLPRLTASFVGRDAEMSEVRKLVAEYRMVTLTGAGGSGKTRLGLQVAADFLDGSGDGVWFVDLASVTDPSSVGSAVARTLGIHEKPGVATLDTLVEVLARQDRLIILDNCEHVLDSCAELASSVTRHCSQISLLATSREPLRIDGEIVYRVPPLSLPLDDVGEWSDLAGSGAVALFTERAAAHVPGFAPRDDDAVLVASICRLLDGMPLALELAAARLRSMSLAELCERLEHRFGILTGGSRTALPRQRSLRALVDWSYDLLTEPESTLFTRLSVFLGGFGLDAVEAVCSFGSIAKEEILDLICSLVDKSLVLADPSPRLGPLWDARNPATVRRGAPRRTRWR